MDYKKTNAPLNTVTRDMIALAEQTGNVYETVCVIGKRSNQIAADLKKELEKSCRSSQAPTTSRKFPKTESRSRYPASTKSFPNRP